MARREDERINEFLLNWRLTDNHTGEMKTYAVVHILKGGRTYGTKDYKRTK